MCVCINHPVFIYNTRCAEEIATVGKQYPAEPFKFLEPRYMYIFLSLPVYRIMMSIGVSTTRIYHVLYVLIIALVI